MAKVALLIGVSDYEEGLDALPSATKDIEALREALINPAIGGFAAGDVTVLPNPSRQRMEEAIYTLFANRQKDDLVLLYFSGHGILDEGNRFYFATRQTRKVQGKLMPPTAVVASTVHGYMEESRSQRQVVILDSCFSGAFVKGLSAKDSGTVNLEQFLGGKGRAILTASTSTQYALTQSGFELSIYTHFLVEGLRTGGAAQSGNDWITVEDLHGYTSAKVREAAPAMTPEFYPIKNGYTIRLAKSPKDDPVLKYRQKVQELAYEGRFSIPARRLLKGLQQQLKLDPEVATAIEEEVLRPYQELQRKSQKYEDTLQDSLQVESTLSERTQQDLKAYQQHLGLRNEDVVAIEQRHIGNAIPVIPIEPNVVEPVVEFSLAKPKQFPTFAFEVITVNDNGEEIDREPGQAEYFTEVLSDGIVLDLVKIPGGTFKMGSNIDKKEQPIHSVTVLSFWLGKFPVTQEQYQAVLDNNPSHFQGAMLPVEKVLWEDAVEFCQRLSEKTGHLYRLPSEAEWEYACCAGTKTPFYFGQTITTNLANYRGTDWQPDRKLYPGNYDNGPYGSFRERTTPPGEFPPNAFGLYDMHGNVWEWCQDTWHESYDSAPRDGSAWEHRGNRRGENGRVLRGGSWFYDPANCRCATRFRGYPGGSRLNDVGFRVVCAVPRLF